MKIEKKKPKKVPLTAEQEDARYYKLLYQAAKQVWQRSNPDRKKALKNSKDIVNGYHVNKCNSCQKFFEKVDVDHMVPIGKTTPATMEEFIDTLKKLNCRSDNLQILCKICHKGKTSEESTARAASKPRKPKKSEVVLVRQKGKRSS